MPSPSGPDAASASAPSIFHDLDRYVAMPRVSGLCLSPDGSRLVTTVATVNAKGTGYASALWELDPRGERSAVRLTRSRQGESGAAFSADGDLWFTSTRPGEDDDASSSAALWRLPAAGGEARVVLTRPGGLSGPVAATHADRLLVTAPVLPGARDEDEHAALHTARSEGGVDAILQSGYPIRFWDHDLGPATPHVGVVEAAEATSDPAQGATVTSDDLPRQRLRDVTPDAGAALLNASPRISPDGSFALVSWTVPLGQGDQRSVLARIDLVDGTRTVLLDVPEHNVSAGPISPDGSRAVVVVGRASTSAHAPDYTMHVVDTRDGSARALAPGWDAWPSPVAWTPDGGTVLALADQDGRAPVFAIDVDGDAAVRQVTSDDAAYSDLVTGPDADVAYAVRSSYTLAPEVVRIDLRDGAVTPLPAPVAQPVLPGRLEEIRTTHADGTEVRSWLALPYDDADGGGHPLLLWIHGGPLASWNAWTWRWNPWLMVAQGYAVLLPDPALSTGYGQDFIQRGWGAWGGAPYEDLMAATDAAVARPDIDATRTAAMGGSFGGYMANWVAGHTDRFRAVVTHASLWALDQFGPTTDMAAYWQREMTAEMAAEHSPHRFVEDIVSPMLVIHGDKDYRVPIGEGLRLWFELLSASPGALDAEGRTAHRFLYFPHENHWILTPQHAKVWYQVVSAFLAQHVLGEQRDLPATLGLTAPDPALVAEVAKDAAESGGPVDQDD